MSQPRPAKVQEWTDRFQRFQRANVTVAQFCRDEGVSMPSFYQWRKHVFNNSLGQPTPVRLPGAMTAKEHRAVAKVVTDRLGDTKADSSPIRITIESSGTVIHCHCDSLQAIDTVLSWVGRQRESGFKQLIVRN